MNLFIFRRDFRVTDNIGLINCRKPVTPIFIFTNEQIKRNDYFSPNSFQFMIECLEELETLCPIHFFYGNEIQILNEFKDKINSITVNYDFTPFAIERDKILSSFCEKNNIEFTLYQDYLMFTPNETIKIYRKFTPYYRVFMKQKWIKPDKTKISFANHNIQSKHRTSLKDMMKLINYNNNVEIHGGRDNALKLVDNYRKNKHQFFTKTPPLIWQTTMLAAYVKFGCISIREAFQIDTNKHSDFTRELVWREFYYQTFDGFDTERKNPRWSKNSKKLFNGFINSNTGVDIVDAIINKLVITGHITNRSRLIVADYLIHHLHVDWRLGEKFFANHLVDYDPIVNNGNWRWVLHARAMNTDLQAKKFDKDGEFVKKWLLGN